MNAQTAGVDSGEVSKDMRYEGKQRDQMMKDGKKCGWRLEMEERGRKRKHSQWQNTQKCACQNNSLIYEEEVHQQNKKEERRSRVPASLLYTDSGSRSIIRHILVSLMWRLIYSEARMPHLQPALEAVNMTFHTSQGWENLGNWRKVRIKTQKIKGFLDKSMSIFTQYSSRINGPMWCLKSKQIGENNTRFRTKL